MDYVDSFSSDCGSQRHPLDLALLKHLFFIELVLNELTLVCENHNVFPTHPLFDFFLTFTFDNASLCVAYLKCNLQVLSLTRIVVAPNGKIIWLVDAFHLGPVSF